MNLQTLPKWALPAGIGVLSFGAGVGAGWVLKKIIDKDFVKEQKSILESNQLEFEFHSGEIDQAVSRMEYVTREAQKQGDRLVSSIREMAILKDIPVESVNEHPTKTKNDPRNIVVEGRATEQPDEEPEGEVVHIFAERNDDEDWDYETECSSRTKTRPYIIHRDEFFNDEMGYCDVGGQRCFTFYQEDNFLVDERDTPIYNHEERVGDLKFGHGSGDPNIVYIRNEAEEEEYEIVHDDGSYQVNVLGAEVSAEFEAEDLRHSNRPGKFRYE